MRGHNTRNLSVQSQPRNSTSRVIPTFFMKRASSINSSSTPCGVQERALVSARFNTPFSSHNHNICAEISTDDIAEVIFIAPMKQGFFDDYESTYPKPILNNEQTGVLERVSMSMRSPMLDNKYCFLTYVDIVVKGLVKVFGGERGLVNVDNISSDEFFTSVVIPMRSIMDMYPVLESWSETSSSVWVSDLHSFESAVQEGGDIEDYGIKLCLSNGQYILRFALSL
jgi:hypothetical protein